VEVTVASDVLDDQGIALDFRAIKSAVNDLLAGLDHRYLNEVSPFDRLNPSSENLARYLFEEMEKKVPPPARMARVTVWESEDARAEYSRPA
jgi:6-pyruvoyltetrahydropterin/6-carboxytetrahydropterin synthase